MRGGCPRCCFCQIEQALGRPRPSLRAALEREQSQSLQAAHPQQSSAVVSLERARPAIAPASPAAARRQARRVRSSSCSSAACSRLVSPSAASRRRAPSLWSSVSSRTAWSTSSASSSGTADDDVDVGCVGAWSCLGTKAPSACTAPGAGLCAAFLSGVASLSRGVDQAAARLAALGRAGMHAPTVWQLQLELPCA
ncbi:hypothetical protein PHYPSEUDO_012681 [Phytophthora pseudosyringae]|uniref:Uncharacterized protein n=1 Tax=Phytophthora pseudosyringae TaxID=221518 RepID=A0A8T1V792_9STRA|nr:hypothetical protein PHYPSEUDO_012681 [Phytophthora pseudosyringae]